MEGYKAAPALALLLSCCVTLAAGTAESKPKSAGASRYASTGSTGYAVRGDRNRKPLSDDINRDGYPDAVVATQSRAVGAASYDPYQSYYGGADRRLGYSLDRYRLRSAGYDRGHSTGSGYDRGLAPGYDRGLARGYDRGLARGYDRGHGFDRYHGDSRGYDIDFLLALERAGIVIGPNGFLYYGSQRVVIGADGIIYPYDEYASIGRPGYDNDFSYYGDQHYGQGYDREAYLYRRALLERAIRSRPTIQRYGQPFAG